MRRWKAIKNISRGYFRPLKKGDVFTVCSDDRVCCPLMENAKGQKWRIWTELLVEIDEAGNTIRTYKEGETLDGGTLVKQEEKNMEGLEEAIIKGVHSRAANIGGNYYSDVRLLLAEVQRLRDEREKNPGVWDNAPEWATTARPRYQNQEKVYEEWGQLYTRELPKTLEQETADEYYGRIICADDESDAKDIIDDIISEFKKRTK